MFVKSYSHTNNGREAVLSLCTQYLGTGHISKVMLSADLTLDTIFWNGKARNFSWDGFVSWISDGFMELEENNKGRTEEGKVQALLRAVRDPKLAAAKAVVNATPTTGPTTRRRSITLVDNLPLTSQSISKPETYLWSPPVNFNAGDVAADVAATAELFAVGTVGGTSFVAHEGKEVAIVTPLPVSFLIMDSTLAMSGINYPTKNTNTSTNCTKQIPLSTDSELP